MPSYTLLSVRHKVEVPTWQCSSCSAYFSDGGPVSYDDVDLTDYYARNAAPIRHRLQRMFDFFEKRVAPGRFIDVGTGMGYSLEVARARGWSVAGIEPNESLVRSALDRGLPVQHGYLGDDGGPEFDLVLVDNVLEHVLDPAAFLRRVAKLMAPGAELVIAVPPVDWLRRLFGNFEYVRERVTAPQINVFAEVDEHVNIMGRRAMHRLLKQVGLTLEPIRFHHSPVFNNAVVRVAGLDDGYYFARRSPC